MAAVPWLEPRCRAAHPGRARCRLLGGSVHHQVRSRRRRTGKRPHRQHRLVAAEVGDSVSDSIKESRITQVMVCLPNDYPFSSTNLTSQCPSYVDAVAYQYMEPPSPFATFASLCIIFLSISCCIHTCLFGSVNDRERMCDMFIGVFIHSLVRAMCDDDD